MIQRRFTVEGAQLKAEVSDLIIAGWTGRDRDSLEHHILELEAIGVARPRTIPCFYRCGTELLTSAHAIDVTGTDSSGEAEFVLVALPEGLHVGVGSDHTDRKVEAYGVTVSKQMCPKPVGQELWPYRELAGHWDSLFLRSFVTRGDVRALYQEGSVSRMLHPEDLMSRLSGRGSLPGGTLMFCGTLPLLQPMGPAALFELELEDPILGRTLRHSYTPRQLPYSD